MTDAMNINKVFNEVDVRRIIFTNKTYIIKQKLIKKQKVLYDNLIKELNYFVNIENNKNILCFILFMRDRKKKDKLYFKKLKN